MIYTRVKADTTLCRRMGLCMYLSGGWTNMFLWTCMHMYTCMRMCLLDMYMHGYMNSHEPQTLKPRGLELLRILSEGGPSWPHLLDFLGRL